MSFNYKDVLSRILDCPKDNRTRSAQSFWKKETVLYKKLYNQYKNENFWANLNLHDCSCSNGRIKSLAFFLDKKKPYWSQVLKRKWKIFNYKPEPFQNKPFNKDIKIHSEYPTNKKSLRNFFKK